MQFTKPQLIILGAAGVVLLFFLLVFFGIIPGIRDDIRLPQAYLEFWGVGDEQNDWADTINGFESTHSNISVKYTKLDPANYEKQLLDALASGSGPDVFMFHNAWLLKHANKAVPAPVDKLVLSTF